MKKSKIKEFFATSWAIDNKSSVYVLVILVVILGVMVFRSIPKEQLPDTVIPTVMVNTIYPGTSPTDIENLVTRPIEKQLKAVSNVKTVTSTSVQDFSSIIVEFNTNVEAAEAKQKVRDAVDKAKSELPGDIYQGPDVIEIDFAEMPIMSIQISGNYDLEKLRKYAEIAQDRIESLKEITRVDVVGALEREVQVNIDMYKMQVAAVSMYDVEKAISYENHTISAGEISMDGMKRNVRITGEFKNVDDIKNIVVVSTSGARVYLKDIAEVTDGFKTQESFSRVNGQNVITLNVIKRSGENLLEASEKVNKIVYQDLKNNEFPSDLQISSTGDRSKYTKSSFEDLNNTIIIGFVLIMLLLMFFMGLTNAFFVGLSVPLSMLIACLVFPGIGFTMNMIVMFGMIFALGIIVDDAVVVIENTHRLHRNEHNIVKAAKSAAGEVFVPILSGTLTTLAPFFPLVFWPGLIGEFLYYLPVTVIITLTASLFVAYIINPVFAVSFMKHEYDKYQKPVNKKKVIFFGIGTAVLATAFYLLKWPGLANFTIFAYLMVLLYEYVLRRTIHHFREKTWPRVMAGYEKILRRLLRRKTPYAVLGGVSLLLILTLVIVGIWTPKIVFFPDNQPNSISVVTTLPIGTDQKVTDSITKIVEKRVGEVLGKNNPLVESVNANVTNGISEGFDFDRFPATNKSKVTVYFVEFKYRHGEKTNPYVAKIRDAVKNIPGAQTTVVKEKLSPPIGKPINIEVSSEDMVSLVETAKSFKQHLDSMQIPGVDELKWDFDESKPEILIDIDRVRANREGLSTGQIGSELRTAIFGKEISKIKQNEDEFPIIIRVDEKQSKNFNSILDQKITYRDMNTFWLRQVPLSSLVTVDYTNSYGGIKRKNFKRVITISSEVLPGYNANEIVNRISNEAERFAKDDNVEIKMTGETEYMQETIDFLTKCMIIALGLIFFILITQFNSVSKSLIILSEVIFSVIGVLLGIMIFGMEISVIMTGLAVLALGGIVVRNGILIVEFSDTLRAKGMKTRNAIVEAGKTRITPVLLTAVATMLGLVPLAIGMNINFVTLFTELNPHIFFGGDNVMFWGNLAWSIIFGLSFATFLTLLLVPAMYLIITELKVRVQRRKSNKLFKKKIVIELPKV
ncbi:MAG TPA: efflux RND transporter permease subunit [Bacteroidales bacterium]|nr:efflux RND transporter permease subunit [Bacteroidales bacterium]